MSFLWRSLYEDGATVEEVALEFGVAPSRVRRELLAFGTTMRPKGQRVGTVKNNPRYVAKAEAAVPPAVLAGTRGAHRRRGPKKVA